MFGGPPGPNGGRSFCCGSAPLLLVGGEELGGLFDVVVEVDNVAKVDDDITKLLLVTNVDDEIGLELFVNRLSRLCDERCSGVAWFVGSGTPWYPSHLTICARKPTKSKQAKIVCLIDCMVEDTKSVKCTTLRKLATEHHSEGMAGY